MIRCPLIVCASVQINNLQTQINRGIHHERVPETVTDFSAGLLRVRIRDTGTFIVRDDGCQ